MANMATAGKFGGLLVALGLFGMGPGTLLADEVRAWRKKNEDHEDSSEHSHPLDGLEHTEGDLMGTLSKRYTHPPPEANEFLAHPFAPAATTTVANGSLVGVGAPAPKNPPPPAPGVLATTVIPANNESVKNTTAVPYFFAWFSFLTDSAPPKGE